jgi:hypothetical protein
MTLTELKALLETMPDANHVSLVIQEYDRTSGHAIATRFDLEAVQMNTRGDELLLITTVPVITEEDVA